MKNKTKTYKKLISLNPKKYKEIQDKKAIEQYANYLLHFFMYERFDNIRGYKTFNEWLKTEI